MPAADYMHGAAAAVRRQTLAPQAQRILKLQCTHIAEALSAGMPDSASRVLTC